MQMTEALDDVSLDQLRRNAAHCITYGFFESAAPGRYQAIAQAGSAEELVTAINSFLEAAKPKKDARQAGMSEFDYTAYCMRYEAAQGRLESIIESICRYVNVRIVDGRIVRVVNEEDLEDELKMRREQILGFIAVQRYERRAPGFRGEIAKASSLSALSSLTKEFIELVRPKAGEVIPDRHGGADGMTAEISVFHVLVRNLTPLLESLDDFRKGIIEIEDDREY